MEYPINGSCQCGQLTYQLFKAPKAVMACHCTECQKLSSAPFSVTAMVDSTSIVFKGKLKEWSRDSASGNRNHAKLCPDCGNRIYHYSPKDTSTIKLKLKPVNIKDDKLFEPSMHIWVSKKLSWYKIPDGIKVAEKQP